MSIKPFTERQQTIIANNIVKACKNIESLNKQGYNFISLASGFIAHYNHYGFIEYYKEHDLKSDILSNKNQNMWDNFRYGEQNYEYYMSKREIYLKIVDKLV
jgi:hypothetical protein